MKTNKYLSVVVVNHNESELKEIYREYLRIVKNSGVRPLTYNEYLKVPPLNHYADMICMCCGYQERVHYGDFSFDIEETEQPFPHDFCPECATMYFVPKDVNDKLNS